LEKYHPLERYLDNADRKKQVVLTFAQVESIIGEKLPTSAGKHRPFWGNNAKRHVHAAAWLDAGWKVKSVDMARGVVTFASQ